MTKPNHEQLVSYLYGETDEATTAAIEQHLRTCEQDRRQVEDWRATMASLDQWTLEEEPNPSVTLLPRLRQVARIAAAVAVLLGTGVFLGQQLDDDTTTIAHVSPTVEQEAIDELVEAQVQALLVEERQKLIDQQQKIEEQLLMASASRTHQQVQGYVQGALAHLDHHKMRNEMLALLLPAKEQQAYQAKRDGLLTVASGVERETARQQLYMQQIIARARERAIAKAH